MKKTRGTQASKMLTQGAYEYEVSRGEATNLAADGVTMVTSFDASVESLLTWFRITGYVSLTVALNTMKIVSLVAVKAETADPGPSIVDSNVVEKLRRDGRLFFLKHITVKSEHWPGSPYHYEIEFRNVKLRAGECLKVYLWNHDSAAAAGFNYFWVKEYRVVQV